MRSRTRKNWFRERLDLVTGSVPAGLKEVAAKVGRKLRGKGKEEGIKYGSALIMEEQANPTTISPPHQPILTESSSLASPSVSYHTPYLAPKKESESECDDF